jgi:CBS domain-containing protein
MHTASQLLRHKGGGLVAVPPDATVLDAARSMNEHRIGAVVVMDDGALAGILTERDVMIRVVAAQRRPESTRVHEVMTADVFTCASSTLLKDLRTLMRDKRIRHVPVVEDGELIGMISIGDLNLAETELLSNTVRALEEYITHG